jgi:hypothetical protein
MHNIQISTGELLDRMSILEIKMDQLPSDKAAEAQREYEKLAVDFANTNEAYYYKILFYVNSQIWELQEKLHNGKGDKEKDYARILELNDQRFKLKQKIDHVTNASIREQKGYSEKKCIVYGHLGMGDMYWMNGAVRYFATIYDEVVVLCKTNNVSNVNEMYKDDCHILVWPVPFDVNISDVTRNLSEHVMIACGVAAGKGAHYYPDSFYDDMNIPAFVRTYYFHHAYSHASDLLYAQIPEREYVVVHENKSSTSIDIMSTMNPDRTLTLNIGKNVYPKGHRFYDVAQMFVNAPLGHYIKTLENATELHLVESSLSCLATHLDLSRVKEKRIYLASPNMLELGIFEEGKLCAQSN